MEEVIVGPIYKLISSKVKNEFKNLKHFDLINESGNHSKGRAESHFKLIVVSDDFNGVPLIERHRKINDLFKTELLSGDIHALSIIAKTPEQWNGNL